MSRPDCDPDEKEVDETTEGPQASRPSRTEQTRAATAVNRLGVELTALSLADLDQLGLPEHLREEIGVNQGLKPRGRGRQNRLIGQLLRAEDHDAIRARLTSLKRGDREGVQREKAAEGWVLRLVEQGDSAVEALIADHPEADRQRLRLLVRSVRQDPAAKKAKRARRELLRAIRELSERTS